MRFRMGKGQIIAFRVFIVKTAFCADGARTF